MNIVFICTGNTCRSPMAEHLFKKILSDAGEKSVHVKSAGIEPSDYTDLPAEAKQALEKEGVAGAKHKPQGVTPELIKQADMVLVMEEYHRQVLLRKFPAAETKITLLKEGGIFDPFGRPLESYVKTLTVIRGALEPLLKKIQSQKQGAHRVRKD